MQNVSIERIKKIGVIGAGNMGHQIALLCAINGYGTVCNDVSTEQLQNATNFVQNYLPGRVAKGKLSQQQADQAMQNISFNSNLEKAVSDVDFVIEAVAEKLEVKRSLFKELDRICPPHAILATNSSYIVSSRIVDVTERPGQVCNMHFFNPALVMKCVEVVKGPHTTNETAGVVLELARRLHKIPVLLHKEVYGFLVNRILTSINQEALFLLETGVASAEDIDSAVVNALGHPMGPFQLMDFTGIDLAYDIRMELYRETMDPAQKPSPTIVEKYVKKEWGKKTGKGFFTYTKNNNK